MFVFVSNEALSKERLCDKKEELVDPNILQSILLKLLENSFRNVIFSFNQFNSPWNKYNDFLKQSSIVDRNTLED